MHNYTIGNTKSNRLVLLIFVSFTNICSGQLKITFEYQDAALDSNFYFEIRKPVNQNITGLPVFFKPAIINFKADGFTYKTNCQFLLPDTTIAFFDDGFGHPSVFIPKDTVVVSLKKKIKSNGHYMLNDQSYSTWFYDFSFSGKNRFIYALPDSLSYYTGSLYTPPVSLEKSGYDLFTYYTAELNLYDKRIDVLDTYSREHAIPASISKLVRSEIRSAYISGLLQPMSNIVKDYKKEDYPAAYLSALAGLNFNDPQLFFHTINYSAAAINYYTLYKGKFQQHPDSVYAMISEEISDKGQCEYMLGHYLFNSVKKDYFNKDLTLFKEQFPRSAYIKVLDTLYARQTERSKINSKQAFSSNITDLKSGNSPVSALFAGKPLVIDCWASWCGPCLYQMPFMKEIEKKYGNKVRFVYLSFDRTQQEWKSGIKKSGIKGDNYFLEKNFRSDFAKYFDIGSIPKFIIIDKNGKVYSGSAPRPSKKEKLQAMLDDLIKRKQ